MTSSQVIDQCHSFEWRGPYCSLTRVDGDNIDVIRINTDWSDIVGDKPLVDHRSSNLGDLYPKPRAVLARVMSKIEDDSPEPPKVSNGPRF